MPPPNYIEMLSIESSPMSADYSPDQHLSQQGYSSRCHLQPYPSNTFLRIFALSHLNLFLHHDVKSPPQAVLETLEQSEVREKVQEIRQLVQWITEGQVTAATLAAQLEYYLQPYLRVGEFLGLCDGENTLEELEELKGFSVAFKTHIVVLEHTEKALKCHLFLVDSEAPVVHMETFQGHFCGLIHRSKQGFPLSASRDQLYEHYTHYLEGKDQCMGLVMSQRSALLGLLAVLRKEAPASQLSEIFQRSEAQAKQLGLDSEVYSHLKREFGAYFAKQEAVAVSDQPPNIAGPKIGMLSPGNPTYRGAMGPQAQKPLFDQGSPLRTVPERKPPPPQPSSSPLAAAPSPKNAEPKPIPPISPANPPIHPSATVSVKPTVPPNRPLNPPTPPDIPFSRPSTVGETSPPLQKCWKCKGTEHDIYSDGDCKTCNVCFKCAWQNVKVCPRCKRAYKEVEISRFRLIMS